MNVGGKIVKSNDTKGIFAFTMGSGVINATNAVAVSGFGTSLVAEGAPITVNIPKGSSLNLSEVEFGADTTVEKYGSGRIVFGTSRPSDYIRYDPIPGTKIILR